MPGLKPVRSSDLEKFVLYVGCTFKRQKGSHKVYWRDDLLRPIIIPNYDAVPVFIVKNILRQLKIPTEEYQRILSEIC